MDQGSPPRLFLVYVAAVLAVAVLIAVGSLTFWQMSGRAHAAPDGRPPSSMAPTEAN
ncbi:hypothetical protein [Rhizobium sp. HT1-10]|uniref:hypothetical protein n=1 Tax=Rhizobium sp. HT1-10 TaxID=3111638 RepID=UPI003C1C1360